LDSDLEHGARKGSARLTSGQAAFAPEPQQEDRHIGG